jgi:hypothetical protein
MNETHTFVVGVMYPRKLESKSIRKLLGDAIVHVRSITKRTVTFDSLWDKPKLENQLKTVEGVYVQEPTGLVQLL